jgi:4-oxalocrotonate tautomerase
MVQSGLQFSILPQKHKEEARVPEVYVHAVEGRTPEQKKALMKDITDAVVKHFNAPPEAVVVTIVESLKINKAKAGVPFSER